MNKRAKRCNRFKVTALFFFLVLHFEKSTAGRKNF
jgi:hypothetical protein